EAGHGGMPARPRSPQPEGGAHLLGDAAEVVARAAELDAFTASLVDREVGPYELRVLVNEPLEPESVADLLVCSRSEDEVAGRPKTLPAQGREGDRRRRHLTFHIERAATPDFAVDQIPGPRIALPLLRIREH